MFEIELDLGFTDHHRKAFLAGMFLCGNLSFFSITYQDLPFKILRLSLTTVGAIAGGILLKEHRTPDRFEIEVLTFEQQKEQEIQAIAQQREELYKEQDLLNQQLQNWADELVLTTEQEKQDQQQLYEGTIVQLQSRISELEGIKRPRGTSRIEWVANQIIDVLLEYEVFADYHDSHAIPGNDIIWVNPRQGVKVRKLKELAEEIQLRLKAIALPELTVQEGSICISLPTDKAKTESLAAAGTKKKKGIIDPPPTWFQDMVLNPEVNHLFVNGDTGSGKSTLIDNFICYAKQELGKSVDIIICDPKFPDSEWVVDGEEILPQYKGYERLIDEDGEEYPSALDGVLDMFQDVRLRLEIAAKDKLAGRGVKPRQPRIYVVDEAEDLVASFGKDASESIQSVLRVGRSTKVKAIIIGQNPGCKAYGLEKANLRNCAQIYLRENALSGIDQVAPTTEIKKQLREQVALRQAAAEGDRSKRFYGLVKYPGQPPFIALMPEPQKFSHEEEAEEEFTVSIEDLVEEAILEDAIA